MPRRIDEVFQLLVKKDLKPDITIQNYGEDTPLAKLVYEIQDEQEWHFKFGSVKADIDSYEATPLICKPITKAGYPLEKLALGMSVDILHTKIYYDYGPPVPEGAIFSLTEDELEVYMAQKERQGEENAQCPS